MGNSYEKAKIFAEEIGLAWESLGSIARNILVFLFSRGGSKEDAKREVDENPHFFG